MGILDWIFRKKSLANTDAQTPQSSEAAKISQVESQVKLQEEPIPTQAEATATTDVLKPKYHKSEEYIGKKFKDRYLIESILGQGGIGVVFLARDYFGSSSSQISKPVVIKMLLESSNSNEWLQTKFHQEAEALSRIRHPYVIEIVDVGMLPENNKSYFVMQYVEGRSLRQLIKEEKPDFNTIKNIILQIAQGLFAAHQSKIYHRDLKPENIMLQEVSKNTEQVKIIDFGIAKVETSNFGQTSAPQVVGTMAYMSPEQFRGEVYPETDTYALGIIAYELITGEKPFKGNIYCSQQIGLQPDVMPSKFCASLPDAVEKTIAKALSFEPKERHQTILEFGEEFAKGFSSNNVALPKPSSKSIEKQAAQANVDEKTPSATPPSEAVLLLEPVGGAVPLNTRFYVVRPADHELQSAVARSDSIVLIKGVRQMGKTSLLARGLQQAREARAKVVVTDLQSLGQEHFSSAETLLTAFGEMFEEQLDLDVSIKDNWKEKRGASVNFRRYIQNEVLEKLTVPIVWGLDEVDRLFPYHYSSEVLGLFRSWHNARALDPTTPWHRLTLAITYSTEVHLFITDINQSPFNVGTQIALEDFNLEQVKELNELYNKPLQTDEEVERFFSLVSGQPYLVRCGLHEMLAHKLTITDFEKVAIENDGPYGDHLQRMLTMLKDPTVVKAALKLSKGEGCQDATAFYGLRSAGIVSGHSSQDAKFRCQLYANYLKEHLT